MIVLDTNVVSELLRSTPDRRVLAWTDLQRTSELAVTAITAAELRYGIARLPEGRRKAALDRAVTAVLEQDFADRVLPFDLAGARQYGQLVADRERAGHPVSTADGEMAAICRARGAQLATRNVEDFTGTGVELVNPWRG